MNKPPDSTAPIEEPFLQTLLQYHTPLISQKFINSVLVKIQAAQNRRRSILTATALLGMLIALLPALQLLPTLTLLFYLFNSSPYLITLFTLGLLSGATWLFVTTFD